MRESAREPRRTATLTSATPIQKRRESHVARHASRVARRASRIGAATTLPPTPPLPPQVKRRAGGTPSPADIHMEALRKERQRPEMQVLAHSKSWTSRRTQRAYHFYDAPRGGVQRTERPATMDQRTYGSLPVAKRASGGWGDGWAGGGAITGGKPSLVGKPAGKAFSHGIDDPLSPMSYRKARVTEPRSPPFTDYSPTAQDIQRQRYEEVSRDAAPHSPINAPDAGGGLFLDV